jgi:hypothetical protein
LASTDPTRDRARRSSYGTTLIGQLAERRLTCVIMRHQIGDGRVAPRCAAVEAKLRRITATGALAICAAALSG